MLKPAGSVQGREINPVWVLVVGLVMIYLMVPLLATAAVVGTGVSALAAVGLLALAWFLPTTPDARILRVVIGVLGVGMLVTTAIGVLTLI